MKIGFTGTQRGMTQFQKDYLIEILKLKECTEFCHGDCIGSDAESNQVALNIGIKIFTIFPPIITKKRAYCFNPNKLNRNNEWYLYPSGIRVRWMPEDKYLERNKHIVDNVSWMIACPKEHEHSVRSGTWATIRYAWKTKKGITIIPPIDRGNDNDITNNS